MSQVTLSMESESVQYLCKKDKCLSKVIESIGVIQYNPINENPYAFLIHEIIEQMLSIKAAQKIYERLEVLCEGVITPDRISQLSDEEIRNAGTSNAKVEYIRNITSAVLNGTVDFEVMNTLTDDEAIKTLTNIRGIGNWTAKMYLMFVLDRQDILPIEDGAFIQVYRWMYDTDDCSPKSIYAKCKKWSPYSTIAARFCYRALDEGMTKSYPIS